MKAYDGELHSRACPHLRHSEFVEQVMSHMPRDMGGAVMYDIYEVRAEFREELRESAYKMPPAFYDYWQLRGA